MVARARVVLVLVFSEMAGLSLVSAQHYALSDHTNDKAVFENLDRLLGNFTVWKKNPSGLGKETLVFSCVPNLSRSSLRLLFLIC